MSDYEVEEYGGGFIVVDYSGNRGRFGAAYVGCDGIWRDQPMGMVPFSTELDAQRKIHSLCGTKGPSNE